MKNIIWGSLLYIGLSFLISIWLKPLRLDLSEGQIHSLSKGTKEILRKMPAPVQLKLYYSKTAAAKGSDQIRVFTNHFEYVKDLLELFERHSQNKIKFSVIDPRPDTNEEEEAVLAGLKKFQLTDTETYIFGLLAQNQNGGQRVIEFFDPGQAEKVEYELAKLLVSMHQGNKKRLGIISNESLSSSQEWWMSQVMEDFFLTKHFDKNASEINDVDAVLVFGASGLEDKNLKALDQYLVGGGKVFLAVDPKISWKQYPEDSGLKNLSALFKAWGVDIPENKFAGDMNYAGVGRVNAYSPAQRLLPVFNCKGECLTSSTSPSVTSLKQLTLIYPGFINLEKLADGLRSTQLIMTSEQGNSYQDSGLGFMNPEYLLGQFKPGNKSLTIAARISGSFKSAYGNSSSADSKNEGTLVLIADQDFLSNQFAFSRDIFGIRPTNDNVSFLLNELEGLTGPQDLLEIRSRGHYSKPFKTIEKILLDSDQLTIEKVSKINTSLTRYQRELNKLAGEANENNLGIIQTEGMKKQKELQRDIAKLKRELREVKRAGREKVESIGSILYFINVGLMPIIVGLIFFVSHRWQHKVNKREGGQKNESFDHAQIA